MQNCLSNNSYKYNWNYQNWSWFHHTKATKKFCNNVHTNQMHVKFVEITNFRGFPIYFVQRFFSMTLFTLSRRLLPSETAPKDRTWAMVSASRPIRPQKDVVIVPPKMNQCFSETCATIQFTCWTQKQITVSRNIKFCNLTATNDASSWKLWLKPLVNNQVSVFPRQKSIIGWQWVVMFAITSFHRNLFGPQQIIYHGVFMFLVHVLKHVGPHTENVLSRHWLREHVFLST